MTAGVNNALSTLLTGYTGAKGDVSLASGAAQNAINGGVSNAANLVQGSNALFSPFAATGTDANAMLGNALGLNGATGSAAATSAFQAAPGYQ